MCYYSITAVVNEKDLATDVAAIFNKALQLNDRPLSLSLLAQRRAVLKQGYAILEGFVDPCEHW